MAITYVKISELPSLADPLASAIVPVVQGGVTYQTSAAHFLSGDIKASVRAASAAALPANTRTGNTLTADANGALPAQGGVSLSVGDRLLVPFESTGANNGIYVIDALGDGSNPWEMTRAPDADTSEKVTSQMLVPVEEGTYAGNRFLLTTADPITLNTTALAFTVDGALNPPTVGEADCIAYASSGGNLLYAANAKVVASGAGIELTGYLSVNGSGVGWGAIRLGNGSTNAIVSEASGGGDRNLAHMDSGADKIIFGDDNSDTQVLANAFHAFYLATDPIVYIGTNGVKGIFFSYDLATPYIFQGTAGGATTDLTIWAQNTTDPVEAGGNLILRGGEGGSNGDGIVKINAADGLSTLMSVSAAGMISADAVALTAGVGSSPAQSGAVRLVRGSGIYARNAADTADILLFFFSSTGDYLTIGNASALQSMNFNAVGATSFNKWIEVYAAGTVASDGDIRIRQDATVEGRNNGDTGDARIIDWGLTATDDLYLGDASYDTVVRGTTTSLSSGTVELIAASGKITVQGYLEVEASGATLPNSGAIRLPNNQLIRSIDNVGSNNVTLIGLDTNDDILIGHDSAVNDIRIRSDVEIELYVNASLMIKANQTGIGVFGVTPVARPAAYTLTATQAPSRTLNANSAATAANNNAVLSQVIQDLQSEGWLQ